MFSRLLFVVLSVLLLLGCRKDNALRKALGAKSGEVKLPSGTVDVDEPLIIEGADGLTVIGDGRVKLQAKEKMKAVLIVRRSRNVRLENFVLEGNREQFKTRFGLPPSDKSMAEFNSDNGILIEDSDGVMLDRLTIRNVTSYAVLANKSKNVTVQETLVGDSGSLDEKGLNNATGGILFEEGCERFAVRRCKLRNLRGNGIWTHSMYNSPRNRNGVFEENDIRHVGRDALQAGHALEMKIERNTGNFIGFPPDIVDMEHGAVPVAIDTAGDVEHSTYSENVFDEVNGKCIDLDGFHDGVVSRNRCNNSRDASAYPHGHYAIVLNNSFPDMESKNIEIDGNNMSGFRFGGIFLIGSGHLVRNNIFEKINLAKCNENVAAGCLYKADEPDLLRSGIYLGKGAHRPAPSTKLEITGNIVQGYGMEKYCVMAAPGVDKSKSKIEATRCSN
ncbi:MAG: right-handed parallel beta-helix repeat-containing protein [Bryobacterales bacterium]|nr:right-handed parallel beta-helix repeat-containing protein [Bryobacterales bacterium]